MSGIRFACCWCGQHIQCDPIYAKQTIACPACSKRIVVPQLLTLEKSPVIPVAKRPPAVEPDLGLWTEEEWQAHEQEYDKGQRALRRVAFAPALFALMLPFLVVLGASDPTMWAALVIGSLASGWIGQRYAALEGAAFALRMGGMFGGALLFFMTSIVTLFGGCCWPARVHNL